MLPAQAIRLVVHTLLSLELGLAKRTEPGKRVALRMKRINTSSELTALFALDTTVQLVIVIIRHARHKNIHLI